MALYQDIKLTRGKVALVDKSDYKYLSQWKWFCDAQGYASRNEKIDGKRTKVRMHRVIAKTPEGMCTDHINGNRLDNRKINLRVVNKSQNGMNRNCNFKTVTGYKGVTRRADTGKYRAYITKEGKRIWLGQFNTAYEAAQSYNNAAIEMFGEYSKLNVILE